MYARQSPSNGEYSTLILPDTCSIFYETFIEKVIDTSIIGRYYRGSF
jgi:hypothetical protein